MAAEINFMAGVRQGVRYIGFFLAKSNRKPILLNLMNCWRSYYSPYFYARLTIVDYYGRGLGYGQTNRRSKRNVPF
jgi:hypothetical protein